MAMYENVPAPRKYTLKNVRVRRHDECNLIANGQGENFIHENDKSMGKTLTIGETR